METPTADSKSQKTKDIREVQAVPQVQAPQPKTRGNKNLLFAIIGGLVVVCCCVTIAVIILLLVLNSPTGAKDYLQKTETPYNDVKAQVAKVNDSILNVYAVDNATDKYADLSAKANTAYTIASDLVTKIDIAEKDIPVAGSDTQALDTKLRDYYTTAKELATSYKELLSVHKQTLPVLKDIEDITNELNTMAEPQTVADFTSFGTQLKAENATLKADLNTLASIKTSSENEFVKTGVIYVVTASSDFLDAFITYTEKGAIAIQNNDATAMTAAGNDLTVAIQKFTTATEDTTMADKKKAIVASFKTKLGQITAKQDSTDTELANVKNTLK